eukprot:4611873-Amphidinium_carterae.1
MYPADSASVVSRATPERATSATTSVRTPLLPVRDERDVIVERLTEQLKQTEENSMLMAGAMVQRNKNSETALVAEAVLYIGTALLQTQDAARALQGKNFPENLATGEQKKVSKYKMGKSEQCEVRLACSKLEALSSEKKACQESDEGVRAL